MINAQHKFYIIQCSAVKILDTAQAVNTSNLVKSRWAEKKACSSRPQHLLRRSCDCGIRKCGGTLPPPEEAVRKINGDWERISTSNTKLRNIVSLFSPFRFNKNQAHPSTTCQISYPRKVFPSPGDHCQSLPFQRRQCRPFQIQRKKSTSNGCEKTGPTSLKKLSINSNALSTEQTSLKNDWFKLRHPTRKKRILCPKHPQKPQNCWFRNKCLMRQSPGYTPSLLLRCEEKPMLHQALCDTKGCLCTCHLLGPKLYWTIPCTNNINCEMHYHTHTKHNGIFMTIHLSPWYQSHPRFKKRMHHYTPYMDDDTHLAAIISCSKGLLHALPHIDHQNLGIVLKASGSLLKVDQWPLPKFQDMM